MPRTITATSSTHGTIDGTTAATSSRDLRENQEEVVTNMSKNKRLMDELTNLKSEINMLKQL